MHWFRQNILNLKYILGIHHFVSACFRCGQNDALHKCTCEVRHVCPIVTTAELINRPSCNLMLGEFCRYIIIFIKIEQPCTTLVNKNHHAFPAFIEAYLGRVCFRGEKCLEHFVLGTAGIA